MLTFCFVIILLSTFTSVACSRSVISLDEIKRLDDYHISHIFYLNETGDLLFIDFDVIEDQLTSVNVIKDGKIILEDDVSTLSPNTIYELDLSLFKYGSYVIELVTNNKTILRKEVAIN